MPSACMIHVVAQLPCRGHGPTHLADMVQELRLSSVHGHAAATHRSWLLQMFIYMACVVLWHYKCGGYDPSEIQCLPDTPLPLDVDHVIRAGVAQVRFFSWVD